ncbi:transposase [Candidatus Dependentiae bacterium]|nr:transposase [Candidatus Dependentiae bacterium]
MDVTRQKNGNMLTRIETLKNFRAAIYLFFQKRQDSVMNLLDAISSFGHRSRSVVQLSEAECFERKYSSITDAIADGLPHADWKLLATEQFKAVFNKEAGKPPCFLIDCTPNPRPFSKKLADRTVTHAPNPAPGNKPICVGHQYSCVALLPDNELAHDKKWIAPLSTKRVSSQDKGNEVGMQQVASLIKQLQLENNRVVSVGDTLYGSENCRLTAGKNPKLIHIFRLNSKRNVFHLPTVSNIPQRGRKKIYGAKMSLSNPGTHRSPDHQSETARLARTGKLYRIKIEAWDNMLMRGSKQIDARKHALTLIRISMFDNKGNTVFKRPLWLGVQGQCRETISLISAYQYYSSRYNIEHFFRFGKHKLLLDSYQTSDVVHEENWWKLCILAYNQLYLAKSLVPLQIKQWEKYLPEFKNQENKTQLIATPSQTQRGFSTLLKQIGTPALPCVPRGTSSGRKEGQSGPVREDNPIIFKSARLDKKANIPNSEDQLDNPNPQKIQTLVKTVRSRLATLNFPMTQFTKMLSDTG